MAKKLTLDEFIKRAKEIHCDKYDYSKVNYDGMFTNITIICPIHGDFPQTPHNHLSGQGCQKCGGTKRLTTEEFIEKANKIHGKRTYDYSKVKYVTNRVDVIITCPIHGDFKRKPNDHLNGCGCRLCGIEKRARNQALTKEEFIERANKIHGKGTYDYSKVVYFNNRTDVIITCPIHSDFPQKPDKHLNGCGCPKCNNNKGESAIRNYLIENEIDFEEQKVFLDCKYRKELRFDFYVPKYNLCIESDGIPHFEKVNWNGKMTDKEMEENLRLNQLRDKIKDDYCKQKGIILIRIKYDDNIEEKIKIELDKYDNLT